MTDGSGAGARAPAPPACPAGARLLEPLGLLSGRAASDAVAAGLAGPLGGGPQAFALARLHDGSDARLVTWRDIPAEFERARDRVTASPPAWAGLSDRPAIMGIVNVTPDSFSDGGDRFDTAQAVADGLAMAAAGADIVDVGGESTRPGAVETDEVEEGRRVMPVVAALARAGVRVSIDTRRAAIMRRALEAGATIVNDVSGLHFDPDAARTVRGHPVVVMHMRGTPASMQSLIRYDDVATDVTRELIERLASFDLPAGTVAVDPGIGFAKGPGHNEALLARLPVLLNLGCRIVVGTSRKGFIGKLGGAAVARARLPGSVAADLAALLGGAAVLRVHDVAETQQAVRVWQAIRAAG